MNELQEIDIVILPGGKVEFKVRGVKGKKCLKLTEAMEKLLGGKVSHREHTDEYYQEDKSNQKQTLGE